MSGSQVNIFDINLSFICKTLYLKDLVRGMFVCLLEITHTPSINGGIHPWITIFNKLIQLFTTKQIQLICVMAWTVLYIGNA